MEEKLGVFLLALTFLSFSISLIPLGYAGYGSSEGRVIRLDGGRDLIISLEVGSVELSRTNESHPYAVVRGFQVTYSGDGRIDGLAGRFQVYVPDGWEGSLEIRLRYGSVLLNGTHLKSISIYMNSGTVVGDFTALSEARVSLRLGSVSLVLRIPEDSEPRVMLHCARYSLRYDGRVLSGSSLEALLWRGGRPLLIEINASSAELSLLRGKG